MATHASVGRHLDVAVGLLSSTLSVLKKIKRQGLDWVRYVINVRAGWKAGTEAVRRSSHRERSPQRACAGWKGCVDLGRNTHACVQESCAWDCVRVEWTGLATNRHFRPNKGDILARNYLLAIENLPVPGDAAKKDLGISPSKELQRKSVVQDRSSIYSVCKINTRCTIALSMESLAWVVYTLSAAELTSGTNGTRKRDVSSGVSFGVQRCCRA